MKRLQKHMRALLYELTHKERMEKERRFRQAMARTKPGAEDSQDEYRKKLMAMQPGKEDPQVAFKSKMDQMRSSGTISDREREEKRRKGFKKLAAKQGQGDPDFIQPTFRGAGGGMKRVEEPKKQTGFPPERKAVARQAIIGIENLYGRVDKQKVAQKIAMMSSKEFDVLQRYVSGGMSGETIRNKDLISYVRSMLSEGNILELFETLYLLS